MENVYYDSDKNGLSQFVCLDEDGLSYEYNTLLVLKHEESGRLFFAQDSGCSCPTPFENEYFDGPDKTSMSEIVLGDSFRSFETDVNNFPVQQSEKDEAIDKVKNWLNK